MKLKHTFIGILSTCALGLASCDLNITPDSYIADINFYQNEAEVNTAVIGCYGGIHAPLNIEWALTELRSDNTRMNGTRSSNDAFMQLLALDLGTMDASNPNIRTYWEATYQNINNCNSILKPEVLAVVENEKKRAQFEGEALFIRAYHYFNLVRLFGPTFLVTEEISIAESLKKDRSSVQATYAQIIDDLKRSVTDLQDITYSSNNLGRATVLAAKSLLAKVYLTLGRYEDAKPLLSDVVTAKGETLNVKYADVFDTTKEMNDDIIFTPGIKVFKTDTSMPEKMQEKDWYDVDVITCAAPNLREQPSNGYNSGDGDKKAMISGQELRKLHEKRLERILDVAVMNGEEAVILGAFGCGAFRNQPEIVAEAAANVIQNYRKAFRVIEFAVYCGPKEDRNYQVFKEMIV